MKRVMTLLLVAAMSLALCACGQTDSRIEKYEKYQLIIEHLEDGNYDKVIDIVEGWAGQHSADSATISGTVSTEPTEPALTPEQLAWQTDAVGTWIPDESASEDGHTGFAVKSDGTCVVDGKDYTWEIGYATQNSAQINVLDGQSKVYMVQLSFNAERGYKRATMSTYTDGNSFTMTNGTYFRAEDYTVVEVTNDNWQDYFEVKEVNSLSENAFGEVDKFRSARYFRLKDTCGTVNSTLSSGGVEYQYVSTCQDVSVDVTNLTYTMVSEVKNSSKQNNTTGLGYWTDNNGAFYYGASVGGFVASDLDKYTKSTVWHPADLEILRVQATLYIVK